MRWTIALALVASVAGSITGVAGSLLELDAASPDVEPRVDAVQAETARSASAPTAAAAAVARRRGPARPKRVAAVT